MYYYLFVCTEDKKYKQICKCRYSFGEYLPLYDVYIHCLAKRTFIWVRLARKAKESVL